MSHRRRKRRARDSVRRRRDLGVGTRVSVTIDEDVLSAIEALVRRSGVTLSAYITEVLTRDLRRRSLHRIIAEYEAVNGKITEQELAAVRSRWQA